MSGLGRRGLTLVEVLLAVALTALVATCVYGTVATAGRVRDRLEVAQQRRETAGNALRLLARDLRCAVYVTDDESFAFIGEDYLEGGASADSLQFATVTNDPLASERPTSDLCQVQYFLDFAGDTPEQGLVRRQLAFPIPEDEERQEELTQTMEVVPGARELDILYFYGDTGEWLEEWDTAAGLPDALRLTLRVGDPEQSSEDVKTYSLLVHLASEFTSEEDASTEEPGALPGEEMPSGPEAPGEVPGLPGPMTPGGPPGLPEAV